MNFKKHFHNLDKEVTMKKTILASVLALLATSAHAQLYGEVGYTWLTAKQNVNGNEFKGKPMRSERLSASICNGILPLKEWLRLA